jgi:hypothetical protein
MPSGISFDMMKNESESTAKAAKERVWDFRGVRKECVSMGFVHERGLLCRPADDCACRKTTVQGKQEAPFQGLAILSISFSRFGLVFSNVSLEWVWPRPQSSGSCQKQEPSRYKDRTWATWIVQVVVDDKSEARSIQCCL